ncbi:MAG: hypothetical protein JW909_00585 [Planctomycetes bacterium]|nr:hypothetical protein [Planctomycetota bacterium]
MSARKSRNRKKSAAPTAATIPLGWMGMLTEVRPDLRPYKIDGHYRKGVICLSDAARPRLEILWNSVTRRRFRARDFAIRQLSRIAGADVTKSAKEIENSSLEGLLLYRNRETGRDHCVGYCPATDRVFEIAYHHESPGDDETFRKITLARFSDQERDTPWKWAFFGMSFVSPAGYTLKHWTLNLGDMTVRLADERSWTTRPGMVLREIYPAELALARMDLEAWMVRLLEEGRSLYRPGYRKRFSRGGPVFEPLEEGTAKGYTTETRLRLPLRLFLWRTPPGQRVRLYHDAALNRLVYIGVACGGKEFEPLIEEIMNGLHWAEDSAVGEG